MGPTMPISTQDDGISPDSITLRAPVPLVGTFGRTEKEFAAAMMVAACIDHGDWFAMLPQEIGYALQRRGDLPWTTCPFVEPDFHGLIADGFAEWVDDGTEPKRIAFTAAGIERLRKSRWNVSAHLGIAK